MGMMNTGRLDFQNQGLVYIKNIVEDSAHAITISMTNIKYICIYLAVRWAIESDWLNDRDQFLYPNTEDFAEDFVNDCLIFTLFSGQNHISILNLSVQSENGDNHWIPFSEDQCGSEREFEFDTIHTYLRRRNIPDVLSNEARAVYDNGLEIFRYYHERKGWSVDGRTEYNHNAAFYDIRAFFQGRSDNGRMKVKSPDEKYQGLTEDLRKNIKILRDENIAPKVYEYGFLLD